MENINEEEKNVLFWEQVENYTGKFKSWVRKQFHVTNERITHVEKNLYNTKKTIDNAKDSIDEAIAKADAVKGIADEALRKATEAEENITEATEAAKEAAEAAKEIAKKIEGWDERIDYAEQTAEEALDIAEVAKTEAETAIETLEHAVIINKANSDAQNNDFIAYNNEQKPVLTSIWGADTVLENPYKSLKMIEGEDYLAEVEYDTLDYEFAKEYFENLNNNITPNACSSFHKGSIYGRSLDWLVNYDVDFIIKTPAIPGRHKVIGVGGCANITSNDVRERKMLDAFRVLPFYLQDGMNDAGLYCNINVVPIIDVNYERSPKEERVCTLMLPRIILDKFTTPTEAINYIKSVETFTPNQFIKDGYDIHLMIGNAEECYVVEFIDDDVKCTAHDVMTNFYETGVEFNSDNTVNAVGDNPVAVNNLKLHSDGIERHNILMKQLNAKETITVEEAEEIIQSVKFTKAYTNDIEVDKFWWSEFLGLNPETGVDATIEFDPEGDVLQQRAIYFKEYFESKTMDEHRADGGKTIWQSTHQSVYDLENKKMYVIGQEATSTVFYEYHLNPEEA